MPESPEVQELASFLAIHTSGREVRAFDVRLPKALKTQHPAPAELVGRRITGVERWGKMIDIATIAGSSDVVHVIVHFGHDGWVGYAPASQESGTETQTQRHDVAPEGLTRTGDATLMARVRLSDGSGLDLTDAGQWKALSINIVANPTDVPAVAKLGLDPLGDGFSAAAFAAILANRKKQIKALLQDQTAFAGIGNAYSDEILHAAKISPVTHAASLSPDAVVRLADVTRAVLSGATAARRGVPPSELRATKHAALRVHRKTGLACPVCGDEIRAYTFSGASAQYCPTCQTGGALLA